jgi:Gluconolactonase
MLAADRWQPSAWQNIAVVRDNRCGPWLRMLNMRKLVLLTSLFLCVALPTWAVSYYPVRLDDAKAVYLTQDKFPVHADGVADDSDALQAAIDRAAEHGEGILFVPSGRYRISKTIYIWPAVRVIGYGATRPVFVLGDNTPGYQQGIGYMFLFAGGRSRMQQRVDFATGRLPVAIEGTVPPNPAIPDATPGTFYSAMSNADIEIGKGNPAAIGIRCHYAQHSLLAHMDFQIGSGYAGLKDVGNEAEDLHFYGGQYGIDTIMPSPGWQFTLIDSSFEGQSKAAIKEHEAGLTLVHDTFRNVPTVVEVDPEHSDELWVEHSRFENISGPAILFGNEKNTRTEVNLVDIACRGVKLFAQLRESGKTFSGPAENYVVKSFSYGLKLRSASDWGSIESSFDAHAVAQLPADKGDAIRALPAAETWVNIQTLGVKGDGTTDDTAAIQKAIDEHTTLYIPMGRYIVSDTIHMHPDTVLIGLHPSMTQLDLKDESPAFQGAGPPRALLETPRGGHNIVAGIGLFTGGINDRAVGALWMAGADSLMNDVRFLGGHGTNLPDGKRMNPYNNTHTGDPDPRYKWDVQYPSLWVTNGGGGTFSNIWTPSTFASAGLLISDTTTPGHVYELSSEHHVRNEIRLMRAENWDLDALQTEEERGESPNALPIEISQCKNITIANFHGYRVISSYAPFPYAITVSESSDIRIRNLHVNSNAKVAFDSSVLDATHHAEVRAREFANLDLPGTPTVAQVPVPPVLEPNARVERLTTGFFSASGGAVDAKGVLYFVDTHWQRIYKWDAANREAVIVNSDSIEPENLAFDRAGNLLVVSRNGAGKVFSLKPDVPPETLSLVTAEKGPGQYLPTAVFAIRGFAVERPWHFGAAENGGGISSGEDFLSGHTEWGTKMADLLRAFGLQKAAPGKPFYVTSESEQRTFKGTVTESGSVTDVKLFAEAGGESTAQDEQGHVYVAAGQILVYSQDGKLMGKIDVPERPVDLVFGGQDRRTLYILTHHSLYAVKMQVAGL